jgi:hypothetical protein
MGKTMDETQAALLSEQIKHAIDLLRSDLELLQTRLEHQNEMSAHRLKMLEARAEDHEARIRAATDGVTAIKVWTGLASGGAGLAALAALFKSFLGGL